MEILESIKEESEQAEDSESSRKSLSNALMINAKTVSYGAPAPNNLKVAPLVENIVVK